MSTLITVFSNTDTDYTSQFYKSMQYEIKKNFSSSELYFVIKHYNRQAVSNYTEFMFSS